MVDKLKYIWMDGKLVDWDDAQVHVLTHTLHYGLGAFEGIRAYELADGRSAVFRLREHIRRLFDSCHIGQMQVPFTIEQIMAANPKIKNPDRIAIGDEITIPVPEDDAGDG